MPYGISNKKGVWSRESTNNILNFAYNNDINTIDTAKDYGSSEKEIGRYIKSNSHQKWAIITKLGNDIDHIKKSIDLLGQIPDTVLAHNSELYYKNSSYRDSLWEFKNDYGIKKIGVSVYNKDQINKCLSAKNPDIIQLPLNLLDTRLIKDGVVQMLNDEEVEIHARSIFLQGLLFLPLKTIAKKFPTVLKTIKIFNDIASSYKLTLAEMSLLFITHHSGIKKLVIGVDSISQLFNNIKIMKKSVPKGMFDKIYSIDFRDEKVLNPNLW